MITRSDGQKAAAIQRRLEQLPPDDQATIGECATELAERLRAKGNSFGRGTALEVLYEIGRKMYRLERGRRVL